jgi:catechol 2,3-dioxygenase-like lactoylglutathione lyase family enzyme
MVLTESERPEELHGSHSGNGWVYVAIEDIDAYYERGTKDLAGCAGTAPGISRTTSGPSGPQDQPRNGGRTAFPTPQPRKDPQMDWTLEVVVLPVSDIDRSLAFYRDQVGFHLDHDTQNEHMHVAQLTPPGSGCSIVFGDLPAHTEMEPGSMKNLQLVVSDAAAARQELLDRGVEVSQVTVITDADGGTFFGFQDPDGNRWAVQEIKARARKPLIPEDSASLGEWAGR